MSDTLDFLTNSPQASSATDTGIDLEALADNLDNLSDEELTDIATELGLTKISDDDTAKAAIQRHIADENGTANVIDVTHSPPTDNGTSGGTDAPMVEATEVDNRIVTTARLWWMNPYTGNRVPHGQRDVDGKGNVDGFAVDVPEPNPVAKPPVYDDE